MCSLREGNSDKDFKWVQNSLRASLRVDPLFQKKKGSTKQRANACCGRPINYSNPLFKLFVRRV